MQNKKVITKSLVNAHLLKDYASWIYCDCCNKTVGYLCYVTYGFFKIDFVCKCGSKGSVELRIDSDIGIETNDISLYQRKGRYCCPMDDLPLFSIVDKNLEGYSIEVMCKKCKNNYKVTKDITI